MNTLFFRLVVATVLFASNTCANASTPQTTSSTFEQNADGKADCEHCPEMIDIPVGSYLRGDAAGDGRDNERPTIVTQISKPFAISKFPVTVSQFRAFVEASGYKTLAERKPEEGCWGVKDDLSIGWLPNQSWHTNTLGQDENHPVVCVTWDDANQYAEWLSTTTGFDYRLPSEAEWEYAARGGKAGKYYFDSDFKNVCEYINHADYQMIKAWKADTGVSECDDGFLTTSPVGHYPANSFGLYDVYGNVWEWVADCYQEQLVDVGQQAVTATSCDEHTLRGASWASQPVGVTNSYRISGKTDIRIVDYGFRVAK